MRRGGWVGGEMKLIINKLIINKNGSGNLGSNDCMAVSIDPSTGVESWRWQGGTSVDDQIWASTMVGSTLVLVGRTLGDFDGNGNYGGFDAIAVGIDPSTGDELWRWQDGTSSSDIMNSVLTLDSNTFVLSGYTRGDFDGNGNKGGNDFLYITVEIN